MAVLALVTSPNEIGLVVPWAAEFASARDTSLTILCWGYSSTPQQPESISDEESIESDNLVEAVRRFISQSDKAAQLADLSPPAGDATIQRLLHPDAVEAMLARIQQEQPEIAVAAANDQTGQSSAIDTLLLQSHSSTVILFGRDQSPPPNRRVFVVTADCTHDGIAVSLAAKIAKKSESRATIARLEEDSGEESTEVGRLELMQLMRDVGVKPSERIRRRVFLSSDSAGIASAADRHDLVLIGLNSQISVQHFLDNTSHPTIALIKRAPPLRSWSKGRLLADWIPHISPSNHADMIQKLRRGSSARGDFLVMLGLAAAIASLGLLQDSPAIVIGSMLLAPLMTPMIGNGLALAQANPKLGKTALQSVLIGSLLTLAVSFAVAIVTPGKDMTPQVLSRGEPNMLDLLVAVFSGAAAAYAMARPSLAGSVAGVAIATALVPPLCSSGISLAYERFDIAEGAAILFVSNLVAIVLSAAATFRLMGVTATRANVRQRQWVFRTVALFGILVIALAFPLQRALQRNIDTGKPQPNSFPLTRATAEALIEYIEKRPEIQLIASGRPSSEYDKADVVLVLASPNPLPELYAEQLIAIVRREMDDEELDVEVHCLLEAWQSK